VRSAMAVFLFWALLAVGVVTPAPVYSQERPAFVLGGGIGATYYCIITRCNTGSTFIALAGYEFAGPYSIEGTARRLRCFDCNSFWMAEGSLRVESRTLRIRPSLAAGIGVASDPEFFQERKVGPHLSLGLSLHSLTGIGVRLDIRGREVGFGTGDYMGEAALLILYHP